jgi:hypothetical protein
VFALTSRARRPLALACLAAITAAGTARADSVHECGSAAERGQRLREKRSLKAAREDFIACAKERCPGAIRVDCSSWLTDVQARIPSIVLRATDRQGHDVVDVKVFVDGELVQQKLDGSRIEIDPGERTLRLEHGTEPPVVKKILAREGEHNRPIDIMLGEPEKKPEKPSRPETPVTPVTHDTPVVPIVLAGVGLVAIGGFAFFAGTGKSELDDLRASCAPRCNPSDVDSAEQKILIGNISLGAGIVALGVAAFLFFTQGSGSTTARKPRLLTF